MKGLRMLKKGANRIWFLLKITQPSNGSAHQDFLTVHEGSGNTVVFHIVSCKFVWIEFRKIRWQEERLKLSLKRLNRCFDLLGTVRWVAIDDEENLAALPLHQVLQELDEDRGPDTHAHHHEAQRPSGGRTPKAC